MMIPTGTPSNTAQAVPPRGVDHWIEGKRNTLQRLLHNSGSRSGTPGRSPRRLRIIVYSKYATIAPATPKKIQGSVTFIGQAHADGDSSKPACRTDSDSS